MPDDEVGKLRARAWVGDSLDLEQQRQRFADLARTHPMMDWSPGLLFAVSGVIESAILTHGLGLCLQAAEVRPTLRIVR